MAPKALQLVVVSRSSVHFSRKWFSNNMCTVSMTDVHGFFLEVSAVVAFLVTVVPYLHSNYIEIFQCTLCASTYST